MSSKSLRSGYRFMARSSIIGFTALWFSACANPPGSGYPAAPLTPSQPAPSASSDASKAAPDTKGSSPSSTQQAAATSTLPATPAPNSTAPVPPVSAAAPATPAPAAKPAASDPNAMWTALGAGLATGLINGINGGSGNYFAPPASFNYQNTPSNDAAWCQTNSGDGQTCNYKCGSSNGTQWWCSTEVRNGQTVNCVVAYGASGPSC